MCFMRRLLVNYLARGARTVAVSALVVLVAFLHRGGHILVIYRLLIAGGEAGLHGVVHQPEDEEIVDRRVMLSDFCCC